MMSGLSWCEEGFGQSVLKSFAGDELGLGLGYSPVLTDVEFG